jgi:thiamine-phosphate pyrophosphorylase
MKLNKEIANLQFITSNHSEISHADQAIRAYKAGCKWVQLRMKDTPKEIIECEVLKILPVANAHNAILLINDHVDLVLKTNAHGVHLGKSDTCPFDARLVLGDRYIIGGTANTLQDIVLLRKKGVDYIGLGPFRFTLTKKNLSPVIGEQGYKTIMSEMLELGINIPIVAIGGIKSEDIKAIKQTGVSGIAVASAILEENRIEKNIKEYLSLIHN